MSRDFKIGLICGVVLAFVALVWVAMRPTLSPQARMTASAANPSSKAPASQAQEPEPKPESPAPSEPRFETSLTTAKPQTEVPTTAQSLFEPGIVEPVQTAEPKADETDKDAAAMRYHVVRKDETLSFISQLYYGTPNQWRKIVAANAETIKDANRISPGIKIVIPE